MSVNLYRKYRPQNFEEVVGQDVIVRTLQNAIKNDGLSHAYLFSGTRGTGKTSVAKILGKAVNCENQDSPLCGSCEPCLSFAQSSEVPDIFEIDAASNNGVDEIRKIIENVKYLPIILKYKVYIIDEVHMLSKGAFNALLKTLEEPPKHVIFILATTEPNRLPQTILSRVQRFDFSRIDDGLMKSHLMTVLETEKVEFEEAALDIIVRHAQGGLRDALSLLTKVIAYGEKVNSENVSISLNIASSLKTAEIIDEIIAENPSKVSELYKQIIESGVNESYLITDIIELCKVRMITEINTQGEMGGHYGKMITTLLEASSKLKGINNGILYLEITLINLSFGPKQEQVEVANEQVYFKGTNLKNKGIQATGNPMVAEGTEEVSLPVTDEHQSMAEDEPLPAEIDQQLDDLFGQEPVAEISIASEVYNQVATVADPEPVGEEVQIDVIDEPAVTDEWNEPTIFEVILQSTNDDKVGLKKINSALTMQLNQEKEYGLAKFFEDCEVQAVSTQGAVVSISDSYYESYLNRQDKLEELIVHKLGYRIKLHLVTTQYWRENRKTFVEAYRNHDNKDIYQEAVDYFGKELVTKVNS